MDSVLEQECIESHILIYEKSKKIYVNFTFSLVERFWATSLVIFGISSDNRLSLDVINLLEKLKPRSMKQKNKFYYFMHSHSTLQVKFLCISYAPKEQETKLNKLKMY